MSEHFLITLQNNAPQSAGPLHANGTWLNELTNEVVALSQFLMSVKQFGKGSLGGVLPENTFHATPRTHIEILDGRVRIASS